MAVVSGQERWDAAHRDPASWAHLAVAAGRLLAEHPDLYQGAAAGTLRSLQAVAAELATWQHAAPSQARRIRQCDTCRRAHAAHAQARKAAG